MDKESSELSSPKKPRRVDSIFAGIPEVDYFKSDEQRDEALAQVAQQAKKGARGFFLILFGSIVVSMALQFIIRRVANFVELPTLAKSGIPGGVAGASMVLLLRQLHRHRFPTLLRHKLIEQGVPMCLKCGYNLRGQPADSKRCPECGTGINEASKRILNRATPR